MFAADNFNDEISSQAAAIRADTSARRYREAVLHLTPAQVCEPQRVRFRADLLRELMGQLEHAAWRLPLLRHACPDFVAHLEAAFECLQPFLREAEAFETSRNVEPGDPHADLTTSVWTRHAGFDSCDIAQAPPLTLGNPLPATVSQESPLSAALREQQQRLMQSWNDQKNTLASRDVSTSPEHVLKAKDWIHQRDCQQALTRAVADKVFSHLFTREQIKPQYLQAGQCLAKFT